MDTVYSLMLRHALELLEQLHCLACLRLPAMHHQHNHHHFRVRKPPTKHRLHPNLFPFILGITPDDNANQTQNPRNPVYARR